MKKIKLPRKRKKAYKKLEGDLCYMSAIIVAEIIASEPVDLKRRFNPRKFYKDILTFPNGQLKKVISYY